MRLAWIALLVLVVSCGAGTPSLSDWMTETWTPLVERVPEPDQATSAACEEALAFLRERGPLVRPAPFPELGDTAEAWVRRAETLLFECSAATQETPYEAGYDDLRRLEREVEAITGS